MDSSSENRTDHNEQPQQGVPAPGATGVKKEREPKDDGRYIIFYTFEEEDERGNRGP